MAVEQSSASVQEHRDVSQIIQIDETRVWKRLDSVVRQIVEETLLEMYLARE